MYRLKQDRVEFFLVHPGGPFFEKKDEGCWTIPKGLVDHGEDLFSAAKREFCEETSFALTGTHYVELGSIVNKSGKTVHAWAFDCAEEELGEVRSNTFTMEWPRKSGNFCQFPEVDRGAFFSFEEASHKIQPAQLPFLERLLTSLKTTLPPKG